jgi:hypothetical protein
VGSLPTLSLPVRGRPSRTFPPNGRQSSSQCALPTATMSVTLVLLRILSFLIRSRRETPSIETGEAGLLVNNKMMCQQSCRGTAKSAQSPRRVLRALVLLPMAKRPTPTTRAASTTMTSSAHTVPTTRIPTTGTRSVPLIHTPCLLCSQDLQWYTTN